MAEIDDLAARIQALDFGAQFAAHAVGAPALPVLAGLLGDADEGVRELAVHCLVATADPAAGPYLVQALADADAQVVMAAARGLHALGGPALVPTLLDVVSRLDEPLARRELSLVLGRHGDPAAVQALAAVYQQEADPLAREGLLAGLARLGDPAARETFMRSLAGYAGTKRLTWLELAGYIGQPWLLPTLAQLLHDEGDVLRVAVDARPDLIQALRACDLAVVLIQEISGQGFSFPVNRATNYTPAQRDEVRRFVGANFGAGAGAGVGSQP